MIACISLIFKYFISAMRSYENRVIQTFNQWVAGSNPARLTTKSIENKRLGVARSQAFPSCFALVTGFVTRFRIACHRLESARVMALPQDFRERERNSSPPVTGNGENPDIGATPCARPRASINMRRGL